MSTQTDNSSVAAKAEIRRLALNIFREPAVLDLFCGTYGVMFQEVWKDAAFYFGTDKKKPHSLGPTITMTAEYAAAKLNLDKYNIFDIDTYVSPWKIAEKIIDRRSPGKFALVMTSGESRGLKNGHTNALIRRGARCDGLSDYRLLSRYQHLVMLLMIRSLLDRDYIKALNGVCNITEGSNQTYYILLLLEKKAKA